MGMLILSRKRDEKVIIGNDVVVTVISIEDGKVRLGFEAPAGLPIDREEIRFAKDVDRELRRQREGGGR